MVSALKAGIGLAGKDGYKIKYVTADTQSTPTGALTGAQKLVTEDHVFAVIAISDLTFGAVPFLAAKGVPVIGAAVDGAEWATNRNMFSTFGFPDYTKVPTTPGAFFKLVGATNVGIVGYGLVPSAAEAAKGAAISSREAGLKVGYLNAKFQLGSTNVGPDVLAMKHAGVDALSVLLQQNTGFAMVQGLRQQGVQLKAPLFSAGYGTDLLDAGAAAQQVAQGAYFSLSYEPVEMHTAATKQFQQALKTYANSTETPGLNEYLAYTAVAAFEQGLEGGRQQSVPRRLHQRDAGHYQIHRRRAVRIALGVVRDEGSRSRLCGRRQLPLVHAVQRYVVPSRLGRRPGMRHHHPRAAGVDRLRRPADRQGMREGTQRPS